MCSLTLFHITTENRLLANMCRDLYAKLAPNLKQFSLEQGTILHHPGETIKALYFPIDCLLSITVTMLDGSTVEAGMVGNREVIGVNAFMGGRETTQTEYIVQMAGSAIEVDAELLLGEFDRNKKLRDVLLRYTPRTDRPDFADHRLQQPPRSRLTLGTLAARSARPG